MALLLPPRVHRLRAFSQYRCPPNTEREGEERGERENMAAMSGMTAELVAAKGRWRREKRSVRAEARRVMKSGDLPSESGKVVLQPRVANLRSYGSREKSTAALIRSPPASDSAGEISPFFASLSDYIESSRKSQDFETLSGRLAMLAFAGAVAVETTTGSSIFHKLDVREIAEAAAICLAVAASAAAFAIATSARMRIGRMIEIGYNNFVDSFIDNLVDGLFYDSELDVYDASDEP